ncbi:hypothetical protein [Amycolatopsis sp. cmx-4-68]
MLTSRNSIDFTHEFADLAGVLAPPSAADRRCSTARSSSTTTPPDRPSP